MRRNVMIRHNRKGLWTSGLLILGSAAAVAAMTPSVRKAAKRAAVYTTKGLLTVSDTAANTANKVASKVKHEVQGIMHEARNDSNNIAHGINKISSQSKNTANSIRRASIKALKIRKNNER